MKNPSGYSVLLQFGEGRHQKIPASEQPDTTTNNCFSISFGVPYKRKTWLNIVAVPASLLRLQGMCKIRVISISVQIIANTECQRQVGAGLPVILNECTIERGILFDIRRAHTVGVQKRKRPVIGEINPQSILIQGNVGFL